MIKRQAALVLSVLLLAAPSTVRAQPAEKVHRIGYLAIGPADSETRFENLPIPRALRARGWIEGKNVLYDRRYAAMRQDVRPLAAGLVQSGAEVIMVLSAALAGAVREVTASTPIVAFAAGDLVATGLVASLARPGGNVTGVQVLQTDLAGKRLSILRELVPALRHASALGGAGVADPPGGAVSTRFERNLAAAGNKMGVAVQMRVLKSDGPRPVFAEMIAQRTQGLLVLGASGTFMHRAEIFDLALKSRLPTICDTRAFVEAGCLVSYGFSLEEISQRAAALIDKILKGAKPADLAVEQPTKFEFVTNLKSGKALGITIPQSVLLRADEVTE